MPGPLANARHEAFAQELAKGLSAAEAYVKAGYKPNDGNAIRLKANERVANRVAELVNQSAERTGVTLDRILNEYAGIAFSGMSKFIKVNGAGDPVIDLSNCTKADLDLLAETTVEDFTDGRGEDIRDVRRVKVKMLDRMKALDALYRHLSMCGKAANDTTDWLAQALREISSRGSAAPIATERYRDD